jgi:D-3-phosphoglycerate dehydrogenase / 2-oxoglutarate reductase
MRQYVSIRTIQANGREKGSTFVLGFLTTESGNDGKRSTQPHPLSRQNRAGLALHCPSKYEEGLIILKILAVGDTFVPVRLFEIGLADLATEHQIRYIQLDMDAPFIPTTPSERAIREYAGNPQQLVDALNDAEVLLVHGAPITDRVLDASPRLKIVGIARGGPVNVDLAAARQRGIAVITAPARNAEAVADLTLAFMVMLARNMPGSIKYISDGGRVGDSAFEGAQFFGHELGGHMLGLVGYGNVGRRVASRAAAFGMSIQVFDPYIDASQVERPASKTAHLNDLLAQCDFVSLHARATPETVNFFDAQKFDTMKPGAFFINTARETLLDEQALYDALQSRRLAGAALDVLKPWPQGVANPLVTLPNVIITPHIGGATHEAAQRGIQILADQLKRYQAGQPMQHMVQQQKSGSST